MDKNNINLKKHKFEQAYTTLRIICLLSDTSIIGFIIFAHKMYNESFGILFGVIFLILYLFLFVLTFVSSFIRAKAAFILYIVYYVGSFSILYATYSNKFNEIHVKILCLVIFSVILLIDEISHLKTYITVMSISIVFLTLTAKQPDIDKFIAVAITIMLFVFSYVSLKSKLLTEKALIESEERIRQMAYYDALTGLPNRNMLNNFINSVDIKNHNYTVMFIDLDNFKNINDSFGRSVGDLTLRKVGKKLENYLHKSGTVFRYSGDEFIIILNDINELEVSAIASKIIDEFKNPFIINDHEVYTSPSIGISSYSADGSDLETLLKNADSAMYIAKKSGKNNYKFFSVEIYKALHRKMDLEYDLRKALKNKEFTLYYQPQLDLDSGKIWGLEALIRWNHPTLGMVSPGEFIPIAEETGLIIPIGEWVLKNACKQNKLWQEEGLAAIPVAVNVSAFQLKNSNFVETVRHHLQSTNLNPENLVIEFTESIMQDTSTIFEIVSNLKNLGVKVAIDDFGTGYSSISLLKNITLDILKIDSYFIRDILENPKTLTIIKLIIDMGHELNISIIVEGIENDHQARIIKQNGCKIGQGYLFSFPLPAEKAAQFLLL